MLVIVSHIIIGSLKFSYLNEVVVKSNWKNFTDNCNVKLPRNLALRNKALKDLVKVGDKVFLQLGYDDVLISEFQGYVTAVKPNTPIELVCEDEMWKLKQITPKMKSYEKVTVKELIKYLAPGYKIDVLDSNLGPYRVTKSSVIELKKLKEMYGLNSFFRFVGKDTEPTLVVGLPYPVTPIKHKFNFNLNIIKSDLEYKSKDEVNLKVTAISNLPSGKKISVTVGDAEGEERTLNYYDLTESELRKIATQEIDKLKYDGYRGKFTTFGIPSVRHGDIVELFDPEFPERAGKYFVDSVEKFCGVSNGYKQEIELGPTA